MRGTIKLSMAFLLMLTLVFSAMPVSFAETKNNDVAKKVENESEYKDDILALDSEKTTEAEDTIVKSPEEKATCDQGCVKDKIREALCAKKGYKVQFYLRKDNKIQVEPSQYPADQYIPENGPKEHFEGYIKEKKLINNNDAAVKANISVEPSVDQIKNYILDYSPEKYDVRWYVIKNTNNGIHVDGVLVEKASRDLIYDKNFQINGEETMIAKFLNPAGKNVEVGKNISVPTRAGYKFVSWNTSSNGTGDTYHNGDTYKMKDYDTTLYAMWEQIGSSDNSNNNDNNNNNNNNNDNNVIINDEDVPEAKLEKFDHQAYINGYHDGLVRPNDYLKRSETAAIFFRLLEKGYKEQVRTNVNKFSDIDKSYWANKHISTLANGRIINGYPNGTFGANNNITRGELAAIASRFDHLEKRTTNKFSDIKGHWAEIYIESAEAKGWIKGYPDNTFRPDNYITRAEFVSFVNNILGRHVKLIDILPGTVKFRDLEDTSLWYYTAMKAATNSYDYEQLDNNYQKWTNLKPTTTEM